jgi:hypothetical protein
MSPQEKQVVQALETYLLDFNRHDIAAIKSFFSCPLMLIMPQGGPTCLTSEEQIGGSFSAILEGLLSNGFTHSHWQDMSIKLLTDTCALASTVVVRFKGEGVELERLGATYTLCNQGHGWQVTTLVAHSPDSVLKF